MSQADRTPEPGPAATLKEDIQAVIHAAQAKKAVDVVVLDLRQAAAFTDFFVLCSGQNSRQIRTITDAIQEALATRQSRPSHVEGYDRGGWVLVDCFDFVVHIFTPEIRAFYGLERLWGSAVRIEIPND